MPRKYKFPTCQRTSPRLHPPLLPDTTASAPRRIRLCPQTRLRLLPRSQREIDHETATIDADFQGPFHQLPATFLLISWKRGLLSRRFVHREIRKQKRFTSKIGVSRRVTKVRPPVYAPSESKPALWIKKKLYPTRAEFEAQADGAPPTFASALGKCKHSDLLNNVKQPNIYIEKLPSSKLFTTFAIDFLN